MEERKIIRGVIVEFDFTAIDGASVLFDIAKDVLKSAGVDLTLKLEARNLVAGNCQGAVSSLLSMLGKEGDAAALAREITTRFAEAMNTLFPKAIDADFKAFAKALTSKGLKVVVATRANPDIAKAAIAELDDPLVVSYNEISTTYGGGKWDAWRRALNQNDMIDVLTSAVTGSGYGVKAALVAGLSAAAVIHDHVAYQDFGGADFVVDKIDADLAKKILAMLHVA